MHFTSVSDVSSDVFRELVARGVAYSRGLQPSPVLAGRVIGMYFRHTSTRTRASFTVATSRLGGVPMAFGPRELQLSTGETAHDTAQVFSRLLNGLVMRTSDEELDCFSEHATIPVINAMSGREHPTQAVSDLITLVQHCGQVEGLSVLYVGEANSTAISLALALSRVSRVTLTMACPPGYGISEAVLGQCLASCRQSGASLSVQYDTRALPRDVDVVYATRWETTGTSKSDTNWRRVFAPFAITTDLMRRVSKSHGTVFMHDMPAIRGEDVMAQVLDGPQSIALQQAANKLYGAMAVLEWTGEKSETLIPRWRAE